MQLFDVASQDFFKPFTGINRREYVEKRETLSVSGQLAVATVN